MLANQQGPVAVRETLSEKIRQRAMNKTSDVNLWPRHALTQVHMHLHRCVPIHLSMSTNLYSSHRDHKRDSRGEMGREDIACGERTGHGTDL